MELNDDLMIMTFYMNEVRVPLDPRDWLDQRGLR